MKTKCVFIGLASSFICHLILEEDQGYGGNKPIAGYSSPDLRKARKPVLLPLLLAQVVSMYIMKYFLSSQVVSDDGKKVRRAQPFTERHKEELQVSIGSEQDKVLVTEMETVIFICLL